MDTYHFAAYSAITHSHYAVGPIVKTDASMVIRLVSLVWHCYCDNWVIMIVSTLIWIGHSNLVVACQVAFPLLFMLKGTSHPWTRQHSQRMENNKACGMNVREWANIHLPNVPVRLGWLRIHNNTGCWFVSPEQTAEMQSPWTQ